MRLPALLLVTAASAVAQGPTPEPTRPLDGRATGVTVLRADPVRCSNLINAESEPLYIIDGEWVVDGELVNSNRSLSQLDTRDIVSIEVLGCQEAIAKYGPSARHAAIEITTRFARATPAPPLGIVFPNPAPAGSVVTVRVGAAQPTRIEVLDVLGRRVWTATGSGDVSIPTAGLASGAYLVRIGDGGSVEQLTVR